MADEPPRTPYWVLISVLFSTFSLDEALAHALYRVALDLYLRKQNEGTVDHKLAHGQIRNKRTDAVIGATTGPVFEAELETERGKGEVRFLLTRQGLELMGALEPAGGKRPRYVN